MSADRCSFITGFIIFEDRKINKKDFLNEKIFRVFFPMPNIRFC